METPPDQVAAIYLYCIVFLIFGVWGYCMHRLTGMCSRLTDTIRSMGLAASSPLLAAKLEQQRLRQEAPTDIKSRAAMLAEIARHQGAKARERHAQNRAAHPAAPAAPPTLRYIAPDADLLPPDKPTPATAGDTR